MYYYNLWFWNCTGTYIWCPHKKQYVIQLPHNWSQDLSMNEFNEKLTVSFFKLGNFNTNYQRNIEKQLIVTEGMKLLKCWFLVLLRFSFLH